MAENKTKPTEASVEDYLAARASEAQLADCRQLMTMMHRLTAAAPRMWGPSIVGYGSYQYTYESGRTGHAPLAAFAIRGREFVIYVLVDDEAQNQMLAKLGKHRMGKCCLYIKRLADLDMAVLEQILSHSLDDVKRRYG